MSGDAEEKEKGQEAFNPETGEINWDCPCLKGALEPPCGDFFKIAFSCFVMSKADPKGSDCREAFLNMQKCYQAHPEKYNFGDEELSEIDDRIHK